MLKKEDFNDPGKFAEWFFTTPAGRQATAEAEADNTNRRREAAAEIVRLRQEEAVELARAVKDRDRLSAKYWKLREAFRVARAAAGNANGFVMAIQGRYAVLIGEQQAILRELADTERLDGFLADMRRELALCDGAFRTEQSDEKLWDRELTSRDYRIASNWPLVQAKARRLAEVIRQVISIKQGEIAVDDLPAHLDKLRQSIPSEAELDPIL